jgi:YafQ family addiction module toxin component
MYGIEVEEKLERILRKLFKRDRTQYEMIISKIEEIANQPYHYKPLRHDMKHFRRVHILKSFVLVYRIDEKRKVVRLEDYDHHDRIYKKIF